MKITQNSVKDGFVWPFSWDTRHQPFTGYGDVSIWWKILELDETSKTNKQTHKQKDQWITCSNEGRGGGLELRTDLATPSNPLLRVVHVRPTWKPLTSSKENLGHFLDIQNLPCYFWGNISFATWLLCITTGIKRILCGFFFINKCNILFTGHSVSFLLLSYTQIWSLSINVL